MKNRLYVEIPFSYQDFYNVDELKCAISELIVEHQRAFHPLFINLIDNGDARITVLDDSVVVNDIGVTDTEGIADIEFCSDFYAGCKDMDSIGDHEYVLEFELTGTHIVFDMKIPPAWKPDYY